MTDTHEARPCERCGVPTEKRLDRAPLCDECYTVRGSCCPEFGADDLSEEAMGGT